jgi:hypothetical protein
MAMTMTVFSVHAQPAHNQAAPGFQWVIRVRGGNPVLVGGDTPKADRPDDLGSGFTLYEDQAGHKPLCSVARQTTGMSSDSGFAVMGPDGVVLGVLRPPARRSRWRPRYEIELPDGTKLVGRGGTISAWVVYVVLSPLLLIYNLASLVGGYGGLDGFLPTRTASRTSGALGPAPLKFYGTTDKYKVRATRLDTRVAYAQAVLHTWSS